MDPKSIEGYMDPKTKDVFLQDIAKDRYDWDTRKIFADWLEENGMDDEALEQRKWTPERQKAEDGVREFVQKLNDHNLERHKRYRERYPEDYEGETETAEEAATKYYMTYEQIIEQAKEGITKYGGKLCLGFDTPDFVRHDQKEFWRNVAILLEIPEEKVKDSYIRCAC